MSIIYSGDDVRAIKEGAYSSKLLASVKTLMGTALGIAGAPASPSVRMLGESAAGGNWTDELSAVTFTEQSPGGLVYGASASGVGDAKMVRADEVSWMKAPNTTFGDVTTEDVVWEWVGVASTGWIHSLFAKRFALKGFHFHSTSLDRLWGYISDGTTTANLLSDNNALKENQLSHIMCALHAGNNAQLFIDGVASGSAITCAGMGSITQATEYNIFASNNGANLTTWGCLLLQQWQSAGWLSTHDISAEAASRYAILTGS